MYYLRTKAMPERHQFTVEASNKDFVFIGVDHFHSHHVVRANRPGYSWAA